MALDYFHAVVYDEDDVNSIRKYVTFRPVGYLDTQEIIYPLVDEIYGLEYKLLYSPELNREFVDVKGSLHKFYNNYKYNKNQNFDDFTFSQLQEALLTLQKNWGCHLKHAFIKSFEFGINIKVDTIANDFIERILYYNTRVLPEDQSYVNSGKQIKFKCDSYYIKIYNKSQEAELFKHETLNDVKNLIRIEVKFRDSDYCKKAVKVEALSDFLEIEKFNLIVKSFKSHWKKILMINSLITPKELSESDAIHFGECVKSKYFNNPIKEFFNSRQTRRNHYNKFIKILDSVKYRTMYLDASDIIDYKLSFLTHYENEIVEKCMEAIITSLKIFHKLHLNELIKEIAGKSIFDFNNEKNQLLLKQAICRLEDAGHIKHFPISNKYILI